MKKVALSLAGVLAAAAFAPEASALPAFARQTGMACSACHFQHFPVLNGFGQAFRASGYTLMGAQGKVEGEHLSLPDTMNAAFLLKVRYQKNNNAVAAGTTPGSSEATGQVQFPDEYSLFFGGRIADSDNIKIGFMTENAPLGGGFGAGIFNGIKVPVVVSLGAADVLVVPYITDALGAAYGFEQSSTGVTRGIRWAEHRREVSAAQFTGVGSGAAQGVAFVAKTDMGYVNFSKWHAGVGTGNMTSTWLRVAATPTVADWNLHVGFGLASGSSQAATADAGVETKGNTIDVQAQGELAGMETSFYLQNSTANKTSAAAAASGFVNQYNNSTVNDVKATSVGADFTVIPHTLSVGVALRNGKNKGGFTDNATTVAVVYDLFMNVALVANYSMYSGNAKDNGGYATHCGTVTGSNCMTLMLEASY